MNGRLLLLCFATSFLTPHVAAQAPDAIPAKSPRTEQTYPQPAGDEQGFESIFDGKSLDGWEGDPTYWRVEGGAIVGEVTPDTLLQKNSFLIYRAATAGDFELKAEYRVSARGNSGINYRSRFTPHGDAPWAMQGYQFDIDGPNRYTGQNYEERGRTFLAKRGQVTRAYGDAQREIIATVGNETELAEFVNNDDWNTAHIVARGGMLTHILNGHIMSVVVDDDTEHRRLQGQIGVQVHVGPPMNIEYRNVRLKQLDSAAE